MALIFDWWVTEVAVLLLSIFIGVYFYFMHMFSYWEKRGIPFIKPSFPFGNVRDVLFVRKQFGMYFGDVYKQMPGHKVVGVFQVHRPTLVLRDLDIIRNFLVKDFAYFQDRGISYDEKNDPISGHLFFMGGPKWKTLRAKLTPTFTSGKMKMMFDEVLKCGKELGDCMQRVGGGGEPLEVKDLLSRYGTDVIATCAFGIQCNCLRDPDAEFRIKGREFFNPSYKTMVGTLLNVMVPSLGAKLNFGNVPKHIASFFQAIVKETVEYRETNDVTRRDFMQLLIQLKNKGFIEGDSQDAGTKDTAHMTKLTLDEMTAQAFVFFLAGFETSSTTVSFCLHELAFNPDIQRRLRTEITATLDKHGGQLTYEALSDMEYLAMVIDETLRKYPPLPILNRICNSKYTMPETGLVIEPGTAIVVPIYGMHYDPQYYSDPDKFNPEHFSKDEKAARQHYTFMPFGEGPRSCIGARFGYMQAKVALVTLLSRFEFSVSEKTISNVTMKCDSITLASQGGLYLNITKI